MTATKPNKGKQLRSTSKVKPELLWNVLVRNDWQNSMLHVVIILKKVIPGMTIKRATAVM